MQPFIKVRGLQKSFTIAGESLDILKGIDLDINEGEMLAIMGPSGVGKSTFLHILGALDKPTSGEVFYGDIDITGLKNDALANFRNKAVGFVFQFHHLLPEFTALENTMMPALIGMGSKVRGVNGLSYKEIIKNAESLLDELGIY
ncbi:MAG TPA: lipoprotein-releasing system ATP-binding protein LolD, partial [Nitrospiraceae bacterium]|nr:lipoprotein-releasing system ATP-binding protein LolD [Nitrospiraceae bacterium]